MNFESLKEFFEKHERIISPITLVGGFIFDYLTIKRVDFLTDNLFIIFYLLLAGLCIILINLRETGKLFRNFIEKIHEFLPFVLQFAFGGLFSAFLIFYSQSAYLFTSGAFILILLVLFIGNEFFKNRYSRTAFQIGIYFAAIFSFSIYFLPVLVRQMGEWIFVLSGATSLILIAFFVWLISGLAPIRYKESSKMILLTVWGIYVGINILYFTNIIPPIPLSLRMGDVYHLVEKTTDGNYRVVGEKNTWLEKLDLSQEVYVQIGEPLYVFSSVFAPTDLNINIMHDWQFFNESNDKWESISKITFPIRGGRNEGYRGYSKKENIYPGSWRVDIKTERGQVIGRVRFNVLLGEAEVFEQKI